MGPKVLDISTDIPLQEYLISRVHSLNSKFEIKKNNSRHSEVACAKMYQRVTRRDPKAKTEGMRNSIVLKQALAAASLSSSLLPLVDVCHAGLVKRMWSREESRVARSSRC